VIFKHAVIVADDGSAIKERVELVAGEGWLIWGDVAYFYASVLAFSNIIFFLNHTTLSYESTRFMTRVSELLELMNL
jgi:hypothetical protein